MRPINCKLIGLTGGIAYGKSTVSSILAHRGYRIIDADKIAREIVEVGKPAYTKILNQFGDILLSEDKSIDRKKLGKLVFYDKRLLKKLEDITHPYIFQEIKKQIDEYSKNSDIIFVDIPLLYESYDYINIYHIDFDEVWLVYIDEKTQLERLMSRDNLDRDEAVIRVKSQISMEDKKKKSTRIIDNRGSISDLIINVNMALEELD